MMRERFIKRKITECEQLFEAMGKGAVAQVEKLLARGVSPDCRDNEGKTALMRAAEDGNPALVGVLIRHGADVNALDDDGETALMKAAFGGHLSVVELLAENDADLEIRNGDGSTALDLAQLKGHDPVTSFLTAQSAGKANGIKAEISTDTPDDGPTTDAPAGASLPVAAAAMASSEPRSYVPEVDLESIPGVKDSPFFKPHHEPEIWTQAPEQEAMKPSPEDGPEPTAESSGAGEQAESDVWSAINSQHGGLVERETKKPPPVPGKFSGLDEERIEFDALDNKQVRNINEKIKKVLDRAGFEVGDYVIDTVFKGSYMAVLKPRSQENKRWRKLKKHPDWLIDPRRLTELIGACAVRRLLLAEGIDTSQFSLSHLIELYYARDPKLILQTAEEAIANNYTVRQLKRAVEELREHKDDHDPGKEIIKTLDQAVPILEDPDLMALCTDKDRVLEELSKAERKKIRALIKSRKPGLDEWKNLMGTLEGILSDLEDE